MTLKQLEAFYWAATCINFAVAAERVHVSSSSLSKRIAELEHSLGLELFDKTGRNSVLTGHGDRLLPLAKDMLERAGAIRETLGSSIGLSGRCRLGMGEMSAMCWLPAFIAAVAARHPGLQVEPLVANDQVLERRLEDGELDCAVLAGASSRGGLASQAVGEAELAWVASPEFVTRCGTDRPAELVNGQLFISLPAGSGLTRALDQWAGQHGLSVERRLSCNNWGAVVSMIRAGLGFGLMPREWAHAMARRGALLVLQPEERLPSLGYVLQWRRDDSRALIAEMRRLVGRSVAFRAPECFI